MAETLVYQTREGSARKLVGHLSSDTFYRADSEHDLRHPIGQVADDGTVTNIEGWKVLGYLDGSDVRVGGQGVGRAVGHLQGCGLHNTDSGHERVLEAEGQDAARALTAAAVLLPELLENRSSSVMHTVVTAASAVLPTVAAMPAVAEAVGPGSAGGAVVGSTLGPGFPVGPPALEDLKGLLVRQAWTSIGPVPAPAARPAVRTRAGLFTKFVVGNLVDVHLPLRHMGPGQIVEVSTNLARGAGTKLYPSFLVAFWDGSASWASGVNLQLISRKQYDQAVASDARRFLPRTVGPEGSVRLEAGGMVLGQRSDLPTAVVADATELGYRAVELHAGQDVVATLRSWGGGAPIWAVVYDRDSLEALNGAAAELCAAIRSGVDVLGVAIVASQDTLRKAGLLA